MSHDHSINSFMHLQICTLLSKTSHFHVGHIISYITVITVKHIFTVHAKSDKTSKTDKTTSFRNIKAWEHLAKINMCIVLFIIHIHTSHLGISIHARSWNEFMTNAIGKDVSQKIEMST